MQSTKFDVKQLREAVRQKVDALPQRELIAEHDARFWTEEVVDRYQDLALWHATRAGGFGGSQIGALVRNDLGVRADFGSAHDIVEGALLRRLPDEPNGHMRRGVWMEPHHREMFYARWGARRDEAAFKLLSSSTGVASWMRYSPDELCWMPGAVLGRPQAAVRILADFKAPSAAHAVNFEYQCQLAMGNIICREKGLQVDGLMLSQFDWANWDMRDEWIDSSEELEKRITAAGNRYWNEFVMRGVVPPYVLKPRLDPSGEIVQQVLAPLTQLSRLKALATYVGKKIEELEAQVKPKLAELRFGSAKLAVGGISYSASQEIDMEQVREKLPLEVLTGLPLQKSSTKRWDEDKLVARIRAIAPGTDLKDCLKPNNLEAEAVRTALLEHGADPDAIVTEKLISRVDKGVAEQTVMWAQTHVDNLVGGAAQTVAALVNVHDADADGDNEDDREGHRSLRHVPGSRS